MLEMLQYLGVKLLLAAVMTKGEFEETHHPINGCKHGQDADGYMVEYEDGYRAWSPKEAFEKAYRRTDGMTFGLAIEALKKGKRVARAGWNGKDQWVVHMSAMSLPSYNTQDTERKVNDRTAKWIGKDTPLETGAYFALWTAQKIWQPGWVPSTSDCLADDWQIVAD